jgi:hypothetical protein
MIKGNLRIQCEVMKGRNNGFTLFTGEPCECPQNKCMTKSPFPYPWNLAAIAEMPDGYRFSLALLLFHIHTASRKPAPPFQETAKYSR